MRISGNMELTVTDGDLPVFSDKVKLPQSVLSTTIQHYGESLPHPMIFKVTLDTSSAYVGVKEFSAEEECIILPESINKKLQVKVGEQVRIRIEEVPKGTYIKLKPLQFYSEITNWKYYLESTITQFYTVLSKNDKIVIDNHELVIEDLNENTVSIIDTDLILDIVPLNDIMAQQQLDFNTDISEEISFGETKLVNIIPFNSHSKVKVYKLDLFNLSSEINITLQSSNFYNADLIIGNDKLITLENFKFATIDEDFTVQQKGGLKKIKIPASYIEEVVESCKYDLSQEFELDEVNHWLYIVPFTWESADDLKVTVSGKDEENELEEHEEEDRPADSIRCSNCDKYIQKSQFQLHEIHCMRNNIKCSCGSVYQRKIPETHWHCPDCSEFSDSPLFKFKHQRLNHQNFQCTVCDESFPTYMDLILKHKASKCPEKLHECKFCHLVVKQGLATYVDNFENLTNHESQCGNKTDECYKCQKMVKRKDFKKHFKIHDFAKKQEFERFVVTFNKCSNVNCVNVSSADNIMNLCDHCFGPLYNAIYDPTCIKLQARIERKYMLQLNKGCDFQNCQNPYCKRNSTQMTIKEIMVLINQELMTYISSPELPINKNRETKANKFWFCVGESMNNKLVLFNTYKDDYPEALVIKGINEVKDDQQLESWLRENK